MCITFQMETKQRIFESQLFIEKSTNYVSKLKSNAKFIDESDIPYFILLLSEVINSFETNYDDYTIRSVIKSSMIDILEKYSNIKEANMINTNIIIESCLELLFFKIKILHTKKKKLNFFSRFFCK